MIRRHLSYANVAATLALVFAMSGSALATTYIINKTSQIAPKVRKALKGQRGAKGPAGKDGSAGKEGTAGKEGPKGAHGATGPFPTTLPTGDTVVGTYDVEGEASGAGALATGAISYVYLSPSQHVIYVNEGTTSSTCTGTAATPTAPNGYTCIYEKEAEDVGGHGVNFATSSGVAIYAFSSGAGHFAVDGTFAATGP